MLYVIALLFCTTVVAGGRSPNADYIEYLVKHSDIRAYVSDNLLEDAFLDVPGLIRKYNYPMEEHLAVTPDGYVLTMHRIPHGRDANNKPGDRPAVLVMHGIFSSSADFVITGPGTALGYQLAEAGYDVWMGNARGTFYSREHLRLNPDARFNTDFWQFSWDEIGNIDLPTMIDYILARTGRPSLHYVGMSQGTTVYFVMGSLRPEYSDKIISMQALGPVAYLAHNKNRLFQLLAPHSRAIGAAAEALNIGELFPRNFFTTWVGQTFCKDGAITQPICSNFLFLIAGGDMGQLNATMLPVKLGHAPAGAAVRQILHYAQSITEKRFRRYDYGMIGNLAEYGSVSPPNYDLSNIKTPVFLHYAKVDPFVELEDLDRLYKELGGPVEKIRVPLETFGHADFMWGIDANRLVYDVVIERMQSLDVSQIDEGV